MEATWARPFTDVIAVRRDPLGMLVDGMRRSTAFVRYYFGPYRALLANRVEDIEHVLVKNPDNYVKGRNYVPLKLTLGDGLITSEGELWRRQRKLVQPAFHHKSLAGFAETMSSATADLVARWNRETPASLDVHHEMMRLTFRIVGLTLFSTDVERDAEKVGAALGELLEWTNTRTAAFVRPPMWLPTRNNRRYLRARRTFDELIYRIIDERRASGGSGGTRDLLDMLLAASEHGATTNQQLRDELITLALAGHETTANALSWTWYLLSKHPDVERRVFAEVKSVLGERPVTIEDLPKLELTERVIKESMRLFPPVWSFDREAVRADTVGGQDVAPGTTVWIAPYTLHRNPAYWDNPEGFDPDRFLPEAERARPRFAYMPFGGGPRICIGNAFAMMEAKIVLAAIVRRYRLVLVPGHRVIEDPSITLRPKNGVQVILTPRPE